ncbi:unnamed protein product, partial [Prorocentrum cordatum]
MTALKGEMPPPDCNRTLGAPIGEGQEVPGRGKTRACAGDLEMVVRDLRHLRSVRAVFKEAGDIACLVSKAAKCILIFLGQQFNEFLKLKYFRWRPLNMPEWSTFQSQDKAKYLGMWLGPGVLGNEWFAPRRKYFHRCRELTAAGMAAEYADWMRASERDGPALTSMVALSLASLVRAALFTLSAWREALEDLRGNAGTHLPFVSVFAGAFPSSLWKQPPLALILEDASLGFPAHPKLYSAGLTALRSLEQDRNDNPTLSTKQLHPQKMIHRAIRDHLYPERLNLTLSQRLLAAMSSPSQPIVSPEAAMAQFRLVRFRV